MAVPFESWVGASASTAGVRFEGRPISITSCRGRGYPDNGLANLVLAHDRCNEQKSAFMAAGTHVERWREWMELQRTELERVARELGWENYPARTLGVARGIYLRLPGEARLWLAASSFTTAAADLARLRSALAA